MKIVTFNVEDNILKEFDIVAKLHQRHRTGQLNAVMIESIKEEKKVNPKSFKGEVK